MVLGGLDEFGRLIDHIHLIAKLMIECLCKVPGNEFELVRGAMNMMCEFMSLEMEWFNGELPLAHQIALRPVIIGLYDVRCCCSNPFDSS